MTLKCLIVDDERPALKLLTAYIAKIPHLELCASCENAMQAISALQKHQVDLMFLDIQMPDLTGLELLQTLKIKPAVHRVEEKSSRMIVQGNQEIFWINLFICALPINWKGSAYAISFMWKACGNTLLFLQRIKGL